MRTRNGLVINNCLSFFSPMGSLPHDHWKCIVCRFSSSLAAEISAFLVSKEQGREGKCRKENNTAAEELHPVLPSGSNSCLMLNKYLGPSCSQVMPWHSLLFMWFIQNINTKCTCNRSMENMQNAYKACILFYRKEIVLCSKELKISAIYSTSRDMNLEKKQQNKLFE